MATRVEKCDIIVIGGGSAAFEAAVAAREAGAERVVMLEKAPEAEYGGNARYSGTGFRFVHAGAQGNPPIRARGGRGDVRHDGDPALQRRRLHGRPRPHDARPHEPRAGANAGRGIERRGALDARRRHQMGAAEGARQGRRQALFRARHRASMSPAAASASSTQWRQHRRRARHRDPLRVAGLRHSSATCAASRACRVSGPDGRYDLMAQGRDRLRRRLPGQSGNARALSCRQHRHDEGARHQA